MNLLDPVPELNPLDDLRQSIRPRDPPPLSLGQHHQLEDHGKGAAAITLGQGHGISRRNLIVWGITNLSPQAPLRSPP